MFSRKISSAMHIAIFVATTQVALGALISNNVVSRNEQLRKMNKALLSALREISVGQSEGWEVFHEESNMFCKDSANRIGTPGWNGLGFHDSFEHCAEACANFEGCKFAAYRTDSGRGQCNGWTADCILSENQPTRFFIIAKMNDDPASSATEESIEPSAEEPPASIIQASSEDSSGHEQFKLMVKIAFDEVKLLEEFKTKFVLPALIRKAFHDAGHFDQNNGEMRMGCIQHFLTGSAACPQHANLEEADSFVDAVMAKVMPLFTSFSSADAVQLLGALAVDELAQGTNTPILYDRIRTGRADPQASTCIDGKSMCNNLPAFFTRHHAVDDNDDILVSLNDVWEKEIDGKMISVNSLSKREAVALIGAHTVGSVAFFGAWVEQPMIFDNEYFLQLKRVKDWLDSGGQFGDLGHPFGSVRSNWFIDSNKVEDSNAPFAGVPIMMMDSDLALVINAPELVEEYSTDLIKWRTDFNDAYVRMGEMGVTNELEPQLSSRRLLNRAAEQLDEEYEFFQNLQMLREQQMKKIHAALEQK